jgi:hypothetical protein
VGGGDVVGGADGWRRAALVGSGRHAALVGGGRYDDVVARAGWSLWVWVWVWVWV